VTVNAYIDGLNLFYGCLQRTPFRWLDVRALVEAELPGDEILKVHYFTARLTDAPQDRRDRQEIYLRALATLPGVELHFGKFKNHQEKGTDVNIACAMLMDALDGACERLALVTNDSDLCEAVRLVEQRFGLPVAVLQPCFHRYPSRDLQRCASHSKLIYPRSVRRAQLPHEIEDRIGRLHVPPSWLTSG
jgi:uncharacterized LabA/DUF88 family protein